MTKKEFAELKRRRRYLQAALDFDPLLEALRKKYRLSHTQTVALLQEKVVLHFNIAMRRTHGKR
jgi:hypothetical protein